MSIFPAIILISSSNSLAVTAPIPVILVADSQTINPLLANVLNELGLQRKGLVMLVGESYLVCLIVVYLSRKQKKFMLSLMLHLDIFTYMDADLYILTGGLSGCRI